MQFIDAMGLSSTSNTAKLQAVVLSRSTLLALSNYLYSPTCSHHASAPFHRFPKQIQCAVRAETSPNQGQGERERSVGCVRSSPVSYVRLAFLFDLLSEYISLHHKTQFDTAFRFCTQHFDWSCAQLAGMVQRVIVQSTDALPDSFRLTDRFRLMATKDK